MSKKRIFKSTGSQPTLRSQGAINPAELEAQAELQAELAELRYRIDTLSRHLASAKRNVANMAQRRPILNDLTLPYFYGDPGESFKRFWIEWEKIATAKGLTKEDRACALPAFLKGQAADTFDALPRTEKGQKGSNNQENDTWSDAYTRMVTALERELITEQSNSMAMQAFSRANQGPKQSVSDYVRYLRELFEAGCPGANITTDAHLKSILTQKFITSLRPALKKIVLQSRKHEWSDVLKEALDAESCEVLEGDPRLNPYEVEPQGYNNAITNCNDNRAWNQNRNREENNCSPNNNRGTDNYHSWDNNYDNNFQQGDWRRSPLTSRPSGDECYKCGRPGHRSANCKTCFNCGRVGHFAYQCRAPLRKQNQGHYHNNRSHGGDQHHYRGNNYSTGPGNFDTYDSCDYDTYANYDDSSQDNSSHTTKREAYLESEVERLNELVRSHRIHSVRSVRFANPIITGEQEPPVYPSRRAKFYEQKAMQEQSMQQETTNTQHAKYGNNELRVNWVTDSPDSSVVSSELQCSETKNENLKLPSTLIKKQNTAESVEHGPSRAPDRGNDSEQTIAQLNCFENCKSSQVEISKPSCVEIATQTSDTNNKTNETCQPECIYTCKNSVGEICMQISGHGKSSSSQELTMNQCRPSILSQLSFVMHILLLLTNLYSCCADSLIYKFGTLEIQSLQIAHTHVFTIFELEYSETKLRKSGAEMLFNTCTISKIRDKCLSISRKYKSHRKGRHKTNEKHTQTEPRTLGVKPNSKNTDLCCYHICAACQTDERCNDKCWRTNPIQEVQTNSRNPPMASPIKSRRPPPSSPIVHSNQTQKMATSQPDQSCRDQWIPPPSSSRGDAMVDSREPPNAPSWPVKFGKQPLLNILHCRPEPTINSNLLIETYVENNLSNFGNFGKET